MSKSMDDLIRSAVIKKALAKPNVKLNRAREHRQKARVASGRALTLSKISRATFWGGLALSVAAGLCLFVNGAFLVPMIVLACLTLASVGTRRLAATQHKRFEREVLFLDDGYEGRCLKAEEQYKRLIRMRQRAIARYDQHERQLQHMVDTGDVQQKAEILRRSRQRHFDMLQRLSLLEERYKTLMTDLNRASKLEQCLSQLDEFEAKREVFELVNQEEDSVIHEFDDLLLELESQKEVEALLE